MNDKLVKLSRLFDEVLLKLGSGRLADERLFVLDKNLGHTSYQLYTLRKEFATCVDTRFELSIGGVSFYLDRCNEVPEWAFDWIDAHEDEFKHELTILLSSRVLVEYKGRKTRLRLFDSGGNQTRQYTYWDGLGVNFWHTSNYKLCNPICKPLQ